MSFKIKDGVRIGTTDVFDSSGTLLVNAPTATKATNIAGGAGGSIPYQSSADNTSLLSNGTAGQFLKSQGTTLAPIWSDIPAAVTVTSDNSGTTFYPVFTTTTSGTLSSASVDNATTPLTYVPSTSTLSCSTFSGALSGNATTATSAGKATNLVGGNSTTLLGSMPYQSNTDTTTLLSPNTTSTKKFLRMTGTGTNGAAPAWDTLIDGDIPSALTGKTYNDLTLTAASTGFTIAGGTTSKTLTVNNNIGISGTDGKTLTLSNSLTFTGTDSSSVAFGTGGTVVYTANKLSALSATTSAELAGVISDETGYSSGAYLVFSKAPTFDTSMDASATFAAFASSTALTIGYSSTASSTLNLSTGAVGSGNTKTINIGTGSAASSTTNINLGSSNGGTVTVNKDLVVSGDLTVNGTTVTVNSTTLTVDDKNIELGSVAVPDNTTADGGGITLKGATDKTFNWVNSTSAWTSSEHVNLASGKAYYINGSSVLSSTTLGTAVVNSSLTKVGALSGGTAGFVKVDASGNLTSDSSTYLTSASTLDASKLSGTIPSAVLGNSTVYIGTTSVALNRSSAALALTGISSVTGSTTLSLASTTTSAISLDSGTTGAVNIGTNANAKTITVGNVTGATALVFNSGTGGATFNQVAAGIFKIQASAAPTTDMVQITNTGQATVTAGVNALSITYVGGAAAVESSASRIDLTPGGTTGGTWNGFRMVASAGAASGVTMNAFKVDAITGGAGTENVIYVSTGWDNILNYNGTVVISGTGTVTAGQLTGTIPSAVLGNSTHYIGTTAVTLNRTSADLALTGITSVTGTTTLTLNSATTNALTIDSGTTGAINIGTNANGKTITIGNATANTAVNITSAGTGATTITGSVKLPSVGTSGFVKLGTGGVLSADTTTYLSSPSTLQQVTTAGASTNVAVSITNATDSTSNATGALIVSGGVAVIKNIFHTATLSSAVAAGTKISDRNVVQASLSTVSATPVDTWAIATYRSARYTVQITQGTNYQVSEVLVIHNGSTTFMTEFAVLETNGALGAFTSDVSAGNARLIVTMGSATAATINIIRHLIVI